MRKSEGSADEPAQPAAKCRWIKPRAEDEGDGEGTGADQREPAADDDGEGGRRLDTTHSGGGMTSSAPPSCYSMAAAAAAAMVAVRAAGSRQRTFRTTRSLSCQSASQYDLTTALQTINHIVMSRSHQKVTRLVGLEDAASSPQKRPDKVRVHSPNVTNISQ